LLLVLVDAQREKRELEATIEELKKKNTELRKQVEANAQEADEMGSELLSQAWSPRYSPKKMMELELKMYLLLA